MARAGAEWLVVCGLVVGSALGGEADPPNAGSRTVPLKVQRRAEDGRAVIETLSIDPARTAVVIIDMWDRHWCATYTARVGNMVPRMNQTLRAARKLGVQVVHAPSDTMAFYEDHPRRKAMLAIPQQPVPEPIDFNPPEPPGGKDCCECGPDRPCKPRGAWTRQHPDLEIAPADLIGDCNNARELLNLCGQRGINTLIYMGVASNMCVIHRQFGMINMKRHGLDVLFVADLVEAITANGYDPGRKEEDPNFTPARGSATVQRHLEQYVAPSIESRQLIAAAGMDEHADDDRPHVVFVVAEVEYRTRETLPAFAEEYLKGDFRLSFVHADPEDRNNLPGLDVLCDADLLVLSMRRRFPPVVQMDRLERYIRSGKPLVAIRTSCVPFAESGGLRRPGPGHVVWQRFDLEVLGCNYQGYDPESRNTGCDVVIVPEAADDPILEGIEPASFHSRSWLYKMQPLAETARPLLTGRWSVQSGPQPVAWTNTYHGGRIFYTSLGHPDDFKLPQFNRLLLNAIHWALDRPGHKHNRASQE